MTGFLLDTNCISEIVCLKPEPRVMAWIEAVATAIHHNLTIVSRNVGDFTNTEVSVANPWEP